jgi:hypothetical protein
MRRLEKLDLIINYIYNPAMASELEQFLNENMGNIPPNHPDRFLFSAVSRSTESHRKLMGVADRINQLFGQLPDEIELSKIIPPIVTTNATTKRIFRGPYEGQTREEMHKNFPQWDSIFSESDSIERNHLIKISRIVSSPLIGMANIVTLGDFRSKSEEELLTIKLGTKPLLNARLAAVIKFAFAKSSS